MPTYIYSADGKTYEWPSTMSRIPQSLFVGGRIAQRDIRAEHFGQRSGDPWVEHTSLALSVHPLDVQKYREDAHAKGLTDVKIQDDGMVAFRSRNAQKKYCRAYGYVNFGDTW
jgi:hypothetical protein